MDVEHPVSRAIRAAALRNGNSLTALAARLGVRVRRQNVEYWMRTGRVPEKYAASIERESQVHRWEMFPSTWHIVWPELVGVDGAPPAPRASNEEATDAA